MRRFARTYAGALLGAAGSLEQAEGVHRELAAFDEVMQRTPGLGRMAANPAVPLETKERILAEVTGRAALSPLAQRFLRALLVRHRLGSLGELVAAIGEAIDRRRGVVVAEVISARPLAEEEAARLQGVLERKLDRSVRLRPAVDERLLGGFVVQVGSQRWDASLQGQLARLTEELAEA